MTLSALPCAQASADSAPIALRGASDPERDFLVTCREAEGECFTLLGVAVEGASVFSQAQLSTLFAEYLMRDVNARDLARIAQRITDHYRAAGYFLSRAEVPEQTSGGIAHINVIEGRISEVVIEGSGARLVAPYLRAMEDAEIANLADMDRGLALASDVPGITVRSRMEPDPNDPAAHRLIVTAELRRLVAGAYVDDRGTENVGPVQTYGRLAANAPLGARDQFGLAVFATPEDVNDFALAEVSHLYVFENGDRLRTAAAVSRSRAASASSNANDGDGLSFSVGFERPLIRRRGRGLWIGAAFDARHQENDWFGGSGYADELRVARVGLRGFLEDDGRSSWVFMQTSLGLDVLGASGHSVTNRSRWDADAQFAKFDFFASHFQPFGQYFGVYGAIAGQWTNEPLLQSEEFAMGGMPFGRAFAYGEISGDRGIAASVEARAGTATTIDPISFVQGYLFLDGVEIWNEGGGDASLASFGGGVRLTLDDRITAAFELARPIDGVPYEEAEDDWRQFFSLSVAY